MSINQRTHIASRFHPHCCIQSAGSDIYKVIEQERGKERASAFTSGRYNYVAFEILQQVFFGAHYIIEYMNIDLLLSCLCFSVC